MGWRGGILRVKKGMKTFFPSCMVCTAKHDFMNIEDYRSYLHLRTYLLYVQHAAQKWRKNNRGRYIFSVNDSPFFVVFIIIVPRWAFFRQSHQSVTKSSTEIVFLFDNEGDTNSKVLKHFCECTGRIWMSAGVNTDAYGLVLFVMVHINHHMVCSLVGLSESM